MCFFHVRFVVLPVLPLSLGKGLPEHNEWEYAAMHENLTCGFRGQ
jgi:hypothetical protein